MKSQTFSISDILTRDSPNKCNVENLSKSLSEKAESSIPPLLPPPMSPEVGKCFHSRIMASQHRTKEKITAKRRRDPIGQILDSLCRTSINNTSNESSAFSPIITRSVTSQLSPMSFLSQYDGRYFQTSPPAFGLLYATSSQSNTLTSLRHQLSTIEIQYLHAQRSAQQHNIRQLAMDSVVYPIIQPVLQDWQQHHFQMNFDPQNKFEVFESCNSCIGLNRHYTHSNMLHTPSASFLKTLFQPSGESITAKRSRLPFQPPRYQCEACRKSYSTFGGLSKHKQFHCVSHVKKYFKCRYCEKSYGSLGVLKMHIRTHTLPCKCKLCGKAFSRPWLLQGHLRTHTGEKPFKCAHCGRAFADRSNLRAHLQTHTDIKKYGCKSCSKTFSRMSLLLKHKEGICLGLRM